MPLVSTVGGASGPLYGTFFLRVGGGLGDAEPFDPDGFAAALRAGLRASWHAGKAEAGDKTMFDAWRRRSMRSTRRWLRVDRGSRPAAGVGAPRKRAATRRRRCWPARGGPATWASAASGTRTRARPASPCCSLRQRTPSTRAPVVSAGGPVTGRRSMTPSSGGGALGVGIVVVSHSRALAEAAVALATEMLHGTEPRIASRPASTRPRSAPTPSPIAAAIERVDSAAGVVVLMDLGSAVLSAELALDLLADADARDRVLLCPAPLVEGLVVAAVAAAGGASRPEVAAEAQAALLGKSAHLAPAGIADDAGADAGPTVSATFTVENAHGLHARPAARLVGEVRRLDATVR